MNDKSRASRFRLSLRALMLIVLVTGGTIGWKANRARTQRQAVAAIKETKGFVFYDFQYTGNEPPGKLNPRNEPGAPKWLRRVFGDEYFQEVTMVGIPSAERPEVAHDPGNAGLSAGHRRVAVDAAVTARHFRSERPSACDPRVECRTAREVNAPRPEYFCSEMRLAAAIRALGRIATWPSTRAFRQALSIRTSVALMTAFTESPTLRPN
jgi:hypothetical protein